MGSSTIPMLLVTANVGSVFEDPADLPKIWTEEFLSTVARLDPKFIALHCQEVGGKNYELSMKHVENFVQLLMSSNELRLFDKIRVFLDEDYSSTENFTALGNLYFIHETLENILIWDFKESHFLPVQGKEIHSGNIEAVVTKEKAKFPQDFFPECKWSRKGFMRTRWSLNGSIVDMVNIHLFHDASNIVAMESYPSVYCKTRRKALQYTLQRFHNDHYDNAPYFLFGDFNFRTDTDGVVKKLTDGLNTTRIQNNKNNEYTKLQFTNDESQLVLTVGKKEFNHSEHQTVFLEPTSEWLKMFDKELEAFEDTLTEFPVSFPPSYPFEEKISRPTSYMQTRCPAWCDRVLISNNAKQLVDDTKEVEYNLMGINTCMGDHKPVYLQVDLKENAGTLVCCDHTPLACLPDKCQCCELYASIMINIIDLSDNTNIRTSFPSVVDSKLLHQPLTRDMLMHEPYTPESVDSHSSSPIEKSEEIAERARQGSVSPTQLKTKLESIIRAELQNSPKMIRRSASQDVDTFKLNPKFLRCRAMSEVPKARLISTEETGSVHRLQSHHSSSDEDWFEFHNESSMKHQEIRLACSQDNLKQITKDIRTCKDDSPKKHCCRIKFDLHEGIHCCVIS
nr:unnamed protein product [Callosobruchus chinensis]